MVHVQGVEDGQVALYSGRVIGASPQNGTVRVRFDDVHDGGGDHGVAGDIFFFFLSFCLFVILSSHPSILSSISYPVLS